MKPLQVLRHPFVFTGITLPEFVRWYFMEQPNKILSTYFAYLRAFVEIFSFVFLLRTMFSPWKQIADVYPQKGFNLSAMSQSFTLNMVSRTIGFLIRFFTLVMGLAFIVVLTVLFGMFYMGWLTFPLLFWIGFSYVFSAAF